MTKIQSRLKLTESTAPLLSIPVDPNKLKIEITVPHPEWYTPTFQAPSASVDAHMTCRLVLAKRCTVWWGPCA
ncbi:hypothetical protein PtrM4_018080 [Pyrenophora tritici-repentis]|uniref:Uncharacterized protein n=1 Tax=Pyrenophora tritici-repentis TaxID=45151 RepID=A0A834VVM7_9PLEO|nr:hypothetical protein PtrM4_018080 [Pyrenophora tritici-repentis]